MKTGGGYGPRLLSVLVADGLRVHTCPKTASTSISKAMSGLKKWHENPEDVGGEYRWMVVRHPLDRLVSAYCHFCLGAQLGIIGMGIRKGMSFGDFLHIALRNPYGDKHLTPQFMFAGPRKFDRLCRLENLSKEWIELRKMFPLLRPIQVRNKSHHDPWPGFYTSVQRTAAELAYAADMALFESSDPFPQ